MIYNRVIVKMCDVESIVSKVDIISATLRFLVAFYRKQLLVAFRIVEFVVSFKSNYF